MSIMSSRTAATGISLRLLEIFRAYATVATAEKRFWKCSKMHRQKSGNLPAIYARALAHVRSPAGITHAGTRAAFVCPSPYPKKFRAGP